MKFELGKITFEGLKVETKEPKEPNEPKIRKGMIALAIAVTISAIITVCIAVKITVNYSWNNQPNVEQKSTSTETIGK